MLIFHRDKNEGTHHSVVGRRQEGPLCDPGSELLLGGREGESCARIINGMKKKKKKSTLTIH